MFSLGGVEPLKLIFRFFLVFTCFIISATQVSAANWYGFSRAYNDELSYYFDADTVTKKLDEVTIWEKSVKNKKYLKDEIYARTEKVEYTCKKRTYKSFTSSLYNENQEFIKSYDSDGKIYEITPDTIGEVIYNAVCSENFPKSKSKDFYYPVEGNNIFLETEKFYKLQDDIKTDLAPTASAKWNVFVNAYNDKTIIFFDADTVINNGAKVNVWVKYIYEENSPNDTGFYSEASRLEFLCSDNTVQYQRTSNYDKEGKFIKSYVVPGSINKIKTGSINEALMMAVCTVDFPTNKSEKEYFIVDDIYIFSKNYFKSIKKKSDDIAPI